MPADGPDTGTSAAATGSPAAIPAPAAAQGKVWTDEYVTSLREEAKENRLARKASEAKLRAVMGLKDGEDATDERIAAYVASRENALKEALSKANDRLITAEIRGMDGYNPKLVERLLDRSKIKVADDGTVTGVKEALEALEKDFPEIKKATSGTTPPASPPAAGVNPPPGSSGKLTPQQEYEAAFAAAQKAPNDSMARVRLIQAKEALRGA